jgi:threonine-phosphate decarboxylase
MYGITVRHSYSPSVAIDQRPSVLLNSHFWLCNPNNPTGSIISKTEIHQFAERFGYVVVDQSYEDYTVEPMLTPQEAAASRNILQLHSLTKSYAIPGLRIGYIVAPSNIISHLRKYLRPWSVNSLAIEAGMWLVENNVRVLPDMDVHLAETQRLRERINRIPGFEVTETHASFFLSKVFPGTAAELKYYLATKHHILIRDASNFRGLTPHHFRISTQSPQENDHLISALQDFCR